MKGPFLRKQLTAFICQLSQDFPSFFGYTSLSLDKSNGVSQILKRHQQCQPNDNSEWFVMAKITIFFYIPK